MIPGILSNHGLATVTLTGLDRQVDSLRVAALSKAYPILEWGVLLGNRPEEPRYPSWEELLAWADFKEHHQLRMALHLCGAFAKKWIAQDPEVVQLASRFNRIQLNVIGKSLDPEVVAQSLIVNRHPAVITQHNKNNEDLNVFLRDLPNHMVLFDSSGGRGVGVSEWPENLDGVWCGYAGGLGPDNVKEELDRIHEKAGSIYWIDMEGKLRNPNDTLDLDRCEQVLKEVQGWQEEKMA